MTRTTLFCFAAVAMIATACERHPANELGLEGEGAAPAASAEVPSNPAGAAPVAAAAGEQATAPAPATAAAEPVKAPTFFPTNK